MAKRDSFVALNIGSQKIGIAVFSVSPDGGLYLRGYQFADIHGDPAADSQKIPLIRTAVQGLVGDLGLKGSTVLYAISGQSVFTRFVKLPPITGEKIKQIVTFEAQQNVPFPLNEVIWDYQLLGDEDGEVEVCLVAIKAENLNDLDDVIAETSLKTQMVDVAPMALYNSFRYNYSDVLEPSLLIDIGARTTNLIYVENERVFTRSIPVGGATITTNIGKEFNVPFAQAEARKVTDGFVSLGGAYADDPDPEKAAMSKVIRNTLTRLHAEIVRTNNFVKQQQGMSPPVRAFICGGSTALPYVLEFFEEKLKVGIEFFNPLRNVTVNPEELDLKQVGQDARSFGELVGLALRAHSGCPMEINLEPDEVARQNELRRRKPLLVLAMLCVFVLLGVTGFYFMEANKHTIGKTYTLNTEASKLGRFDKQILAKKKEQKAQDDEAKPIVQAIKDRAYWVDMLNELNSHFQHDKMWFIEVIPVDGSRSDVLPTIGTPIPDQGNDLEKRKKPNGEIDAVMVWGLYRNENSSTNGTQMVHEYFTKLKNANEARRQSNDDPYFDLKDVKLRDIYVDPGDGLRWAYPFKLFLPLSKTIKYKQEN